MKILLFLVLAVLAACSDPAEEARQLHEKAQADSLRAQIEATRSRIDSLREQSESLMQLVDSLNMGSTSP